MAELLPFSLTDRVSEADLHGAWASFKQLQLAENTALNLKAKQAIGLLVSAPVPCS